jgi:hypothetical protein
MNVYARLTLFLAGASLVCLEAFPSQAQVQTLTPAASFTPRRIGGQNVIVGYDLSSVEGTPLKSTILEIKEGTSDRSVLEFDIRGQAQTGLARLTFELANIDAPDFTPLYLYSFEGNGLANAADYFRTDNLITTFTDNGLASNFIPPYYLQMTFDVTSAFNQAVTNGDDHLGLLIRNSVGGPLYARYRILHFNGPPKLIVGVPEPASASLCCTGMVMAPMLLRRRANMLGR